MLKRKKSRGKNCRAFQLSMCYGACLAPRLPIRATLSGFTVVLLVSRLEAIGLYCL